MLNQKTNILYLRDTNHVCGPGKTILNTFKTINRERFSLIIATTTDAKNSPNLFLERAKALGAATVSLPMGRFIDSRSIAQLYSILKKHHIHLLQTHDPQTRRIGAIAAFLAGIPHIASLHGWIQNSAKQKLSVWIDKFLVRFANHTIVMSEQMRDEVISSGIPASNVTILHNAIFLEEYPIQNSGKKFRQEYHIRDDQKVIAIVGRISPEKRHDLFVDMAFRLYPKYPDTKFLIIGDGTELSTIKKKVREMDLANTVIFTGYREDINEIYPAIDILVISSSTEGLPNVLLEAFAYGKPAIATRVGGIPEVISHGLNGFLVPAGNVDDLVLYTSRLLSDAGLAAAMGKNGRKTIEGKFNFHNRTLALEKLYLNLVST